MCPFCLKIDKLHAKQNASANDADDNQGVRIILAPVFDILL